LVLSPPSGLNFLSSLRLVEHEDRIGAVTADPNSTTVALKNL